MHNLLNFVYSKLRIAGQALQAYWPLAVALLGAVLAVWSGQQYLQEKTQQLESAMQLPMVERLVVARDVYPGQVLQQEDLALREFPTELVSSDSLSAGRYHEVLDKHIRTMLRAGDLLSFAHLEESSQASFSSHLMLGRRALTIYVDQLSSVAGLVRTGDLIDIYVSFDYQKRRITSPILQRVRILAINNDSDTESESDRQVQTLTVDVSPEEGVVLMAARQAGSITAMLRHPSDPELSDAAIRGDLAALLGIAQAPVSRQAKKAPVLYGNQENRRLTALVPRTTNAAVPRALFHLPDVWQELATSSSLTPTLDHSTEVLED